MTCGQGSHYCALVMLLMVTYSYGAFNETGNDPSNATTVSMTTPPDGMCQWQVTDSKGRVCMLMEMNGIIFDGITTTSIPQAARATRRTSCDSEYNSVFELEWSDNSFITNSLCMHFRVRNGNYTITKLEISRKVFGGAMACEQGPYYWALVMLLMVSYCYGALNEASNELLNATKVSMTTPPDGMCQWKLTDSKGRVCMLMEMKGIIFDGITTTSIPQAARATRRTSCDSEYNSVFELEWSDNNFITNSLCMHFRVRHGNYTITKLEVSRKVFESIHLVSIQRPRKSPTVSVGSSMQCKDLNFNMVGFEELRFQPFARLSNGTFGKDGRCYLIHRVHPGVYAGVAILILVVCMVAAYITFKIIQYYRRRHRQNYERL